MPALQDVQPPFDIAICDALVASTPDGWNVIELELVRAADAAQIGDLIHTISSPEGFPPVMPDDSLYDATFRLDELFHQHGGKFRRAVYRVDLLPDSWRYTAKFQYDSDSPEVL